MEAIASIPAPSPTNAPDGQAQMSMTGGDSSFASTLSAVTARSRNTHHSVHHSSSKTTSAQPRKQPKKIAVHKSDQHKKIISTQVQKNGQSSSGDAITAQKSPADKSSEVKIVSTQDQKNGQSSSGDAITVQKSPADKSSEVDSDSKSVQADKADALAFLFSLGTSGYLTGPPQDLPPAGLQKTSLTVQDDDPNILRDTTPVGPGTLLTDSQVKNTSSSTLLQNTVSPEALNPAPDILPSGKNTMQSDATPGSNTLMAQQLQKILAANGVDGTIIVQQPVSQNQVAALDTLSGPLLPTPPDPSAQSTPPISELAAGAAIASLSKEPSQRGRNVDKPSSGFEDKLSGFFTKADVPEQKVSPKVQEKNALLQDTTDQGQTPQTTSTSPTDTMGIDQQTGQLSFGNILAQNPQPGQQTTGTTGTTGSNALPLWTPSQENALVNQVIRNFQISSSAPASKLVLKLYPDELGELKIDLQMRDGAIKANISTHSEQVQQVLEKYIPKLRSFMEQQGLTVDEILVTNSSDKPGGHDLLQQDFAENNDFSSSGNPAKATPFIDLSFKNTLLKTTDSISGVNVTV